MTQSAKSKQPMVRVNKATKQKIDRMQEQTNLSQPALMDQAISLLERQLWAEQLEADFAALAADLVSLKNYSALTQDYDQSAGDGFIWGQHC